MSFRGSLAIAFGLVFGSVDHLAVVLRTGEYDVWRPQATNSVSERSERRGRFVANGTVFVCAGRIGRVVARGARCVGFW